MKAIIKSNGVAIDVVPKGDLFVSDNKVYQESDLYFPNSEESIDWEQRRYELAKAAMQGLCANSHDIYVGASFKEYATWAKKCADALIEELKEK